MLVLTSLVLFGSALVLIRLSSGNPADLTRILTDTASVRDSRQNPEEKQQPSASRTEADTEQEESNPAPTRAPAQNTPRGNEVPERAAAKFTITVAGTVAVEGEVRKNSYNSDARIYDLSDTMVLLKNELKSDICIVFLENRLGGAKVSDNTAPDSTCEMLRDAGFHAVAGGYTKAWEKDGSSVADTCAKLGEYGLIPIGIHSTQDSGQVAVRTYGGVRTAILQYTDTIPNGTRNSMKKAGQDELVPSADPEMIAADIRKSREAGAEAVIILINWGKVGKAPDKAQKTLAQEIADAGADLIIGSGSRIPQGAEYLTGNHPDGSTRPVLCIWCLGTTLSGERGTAKRLAGYLFHAEIVPDGHGGANVISPAYTPLYTWKYKQDGRYYYRCMAANRIAPDGMDSDQMKTMGRAREATETALAGSPLTER